MKFTWWGAQPAFMGWTYLTYEYVYLPIVNWMDVPPWGLTKLGLIMVGIGIGLNIFQTALDMRPQQS